MGRRRRAAAGRRAHHHHRHDHRNQDVADEEDPEEGVPPHHARCGPQQGDRHLLQRELPEKGPHRGHQGDALRGGGLLQERHAAHPPGLPHPRLPGRPQQGHPIPEEHRQRLGCQRRGGAGRLRTPLLPDLSGQHENAELGHLLVRALGARRARPGARPATRAAAREIRPGVRGPGAARHPPRRERGPPAAGTRAPDLRRGRRFAVGAGGPPARRHRPPPTGWPRNCCGACPSS